MERQSLNISIFGGCVGFCFVLQIVRAQSRLSVMDSPLTRIPAAPATCGPPTILLHAFQIGALQPLAGGQRACVPAVVRLFDTSQGRPLADPITHKVEIVAVALSQQGIAPERKVMLQTSAGTQGCRPTPFSGCYRHKRQHLSMQRHHD